MSSMNGQNFTSFTGVNARGSIALRLAADGGFESTLAIKEAADAAYAYKFPHKSGTFPIMGTFAVQLPTGVAAEFSTIVTVGGIRTEDGLIVQLNGANTAGTTYGFDNSTGYILVQSVPGNGNVTLFFANPGNATAYVDLRASYVAVR